MKISSARRSRRRRTPKVKAVEVVKEAAKPRISIGPPKLTRFERARIIGVRALQLSLGAPPFVSIKADIRDPINLALLELESKVLPISIRRTLPDDRYQDIPLDWLLEL